MTSGFVLHSEPEKSGSLFLSTTLADINRFYIFYIVLIVKKFYMRL